MPVTQDEDDNENGDAAFGRMMATHNQNTQNPSRPLDSVDDSFTGAPSVSIFLKLKMNVTKGVLAIIFKAVHALLCVLNSHKTTQAGIYEGTRPSIICASGKLRSQMVATGSRHSLFPASSACCPGGSCCCPETFRPNSYIDISCTVCHAR